VLQVKKWGTCGVGSPVGEPPRLPAWTERVCASVRKLESVHRACVSASGPPGGRPAHLPGATARPGRASTPSPTIEDWASDLAPHEGRRHRGRAASESHREPCAVKHGVEISPISQDGLKGLCPGGRRRRRGAPPCAGCRRRNRRGRCSAVGRQSAGRGSRH
jgi:hypothetical protein